MAGYRICALESHVSWSMYLPTLLRMPCLLYFKLALVNILKVVSHLAAQVDCLCG